MPDISIIIPVWNEASVINDTLAHLFTLPFEGATEIVVVDGDPGGSTLNTLPSEDVRKITSEKGRARQMNRGASVARGSILLFLHADTLLPRDGLRIISSVIGKGLFVGGAFDLGIRSDRPVYRIIEKAASIRSRLTRIPYGDQALFIRKDYFGSIGGFPEIPLMEDVELMRRIRKRGDRIHTVPHKVLTSPRRWEREGILSCTLRNWTLITLYLLGVSPERLVKWYR